MTGILVAFWIALALTWALTPLVGRLAIKFGAVAIPRDRDVHDQPTPRWGGVAIAIGVAVASAATITYRHVVSHGAYGWESPVIGVLLASLFICLWGIIDDARDMSAAWQMLGIIGSAAILITFGVRVDGFNNPLVMQSPGEYNPAGWVQLSYPISCLVTVIWIGMVSKTVDAMDGLDGLAAGICAICAATLALIAASSHLHLGFAVALIAASITGACVGFLRHNSPPARIFMSSSGGLFLGMLLGALSIVGSFKVAAASSLFVGVLVLGVPIFDYVVVMLRRLVEHAPLTGGDQRHLHHRLLQRGLSKRETVFVIYTCTAVLCSLAIVLLHVGR
ncbi:MAG: glycosyltransferase family 4 protein [Candidatus Xenobia bacterium]